MNPIKKRKIRQRIQQATDEAFWDLMNTAHTKAYQLGQKHIREAMECTAGISKKQVAAVLAKAEEICTQWDGLTVTSITVEDTELKELR
ncbi:hypothetical protein [Paenibacillus agricola]|uniref:Uncharacterized protein n=1 Tax=Paenibacillus agricola TaxID=2716264 RepID=A0ABX0JE53_9BACL|nr:hypothetical protein [Paenibacillus agricola]NHN33526.1 hypothetical protein [Paenibacillus agricola]